ATKVSTDETSYNVQELVYLYRAETRADGRIYNVIFTIHIEQFIKWLRARSLEPVFKEPTEDSLSDQREAHNERVKALDKAREDYIAEANRIREWRKNNPGQPGDLSRLRELADIKVQAQTEVYEGMRLAALESSMPIQGVWERLNEEAE